MPNILGGDQHHPAYDPRTPIGENEILIGKNLYEIKILKGGEVEVWVQGIEDKNASLCLERLIPSEVKEKIEKLRKK